MASHDSSSSPPPLHPHHNHQQPPLHHHYPHHHQQQPLQTLLMAPPQQFDLSSYPINPYQHHHHQEPPLVQPLYNFNHVVTDGGAREESSSPPPADGQVAFSIESAKRKRGRPRKNPIEGVDLGVSPDPGTPVKSSKIAAVRDSSGGGGAQPSEKRRGRPPGSVKKQIDSLGSSGTGFTPHVIIVNAGEDVASKVGQFMQQGPRTMCILSANGYVTNCTLQLSDLSNRTVQYEGNFLIVSLLGSSMLSEGTSGPISAFSLTVMLAGPDGSVLGGVAERLIAADKVQVVVGSFMVQEAKKPKLTATASIASAAADAPLSYGGDQAGYGGDQASYGGDQAGYGGDQASYGGDQAGYGGDQVTVGASQQSGGGACSYSSDDENNRSEANNAGGCYDNSGQQQQMQNIPVPVRAPMYGLKW